MKKKLLYVAILTESISVAQPVLQQANLAPIGLTCDMSYGAPSSPGSGWVKSNLEFLECFRSPRRDGSRGESFFHKLQQRFYKFKLQLDFSGT